MPRSIKQLLAETLEDLSKENLDKFVFQLLDRRQEPQVRRCRVEGKSRLEIVDVLVSTFTEDQAVHVTEEILRSIGCNQQAEKLFLQNLNPLTVAPNTVTSRSMGQSDTGTEEVQKNLDFGSVGNNGGEMPPKTAKKILSNKLEDLSTENFKKFRIELVDRKDGVKMSQVEDKDYMKVSEVMINVYTERKALKVAEEILREIRCQQDADELVEEAKTAGLCSAADGSSDEEHFVDRHRDELIQRVTAVPPILDKLLKAKVIQNETYDEIMMLRPSQNQMRRLYGDVQGAGRNAKDIFLQILKEQQRFLIDDLMKK
ncbi:apoptosis-associated speck-like protein containing a CARD [Gambusia affinis]|uniref:apoptosis-associated speck-like protein containing a CARD n=1 Tax=Gambusia affinis TaxID=33528 RepID=UPI001CDB9EA8|nr:apoptosis-associated speck-like protein containing a CARD [Gambusia affinis]